MKADLHFHSSYSDGELKVSELIEIVKEKSIDFACLTDHDSIMGSEEFIKLSKENGIISYPALELSTYNNNESIHVLAYFKSIDSIGDELKEHLIYMKKRRYERMKEFVSKIQRRLTTGSVHLFLVKKFRRTGKLIKKPLLKPSHISQKKVFAEYIVKNEIAHTKIFFTD